MNQFYNPNLEIDLDSPFARDENNKLIRRSYWMDKSDTSLMMIMNPVNGTLGYIHDFLQNQMAICILDMQSLSA